MKPALGRSVVLGAVAGGLLLAAACGGGPPADPPGEPGGGAQPTATVQAVTVDRGPVVQTLEAYGEIALDPSRARAVPFVTAGQVAKVQVVAGERVAAGQELLEVAPEPGEMAEVQRAEIAVRFAAEELDRVRRQREQHLATNADVQRAEQALATARSELAGLGGPGGSAEAVNPLRAPFAGVVDTVAAVPGAIVKAGDTAVRLAPPAALVVRAGFEPEDAANLRPGLEVRCSALFAPDGTPATRAVLRRLQAVVNPDTQLVEALIRPADTPPWMVAGAKVKLEVVVRSVDDAVRVPRSALLERNGAQGVFAVEGGHAAWRALRLGVRGADVAEVLEGLAAGDQVVTTGRTSLADGMAVVVAASAGAP